MPENSNQSRFNAKDDFDFDDVGDLDRGDNTTFITFTQVACCAINGATDRLERRRQSLRAKLEREQYERDMKSLNPFIRARRICTRTLRNLFKTN